MICHIVCQHCFINQVYWIIDFAACSVVFDIHRHQRAAQGIYCLFFSSSVRNMSVQMHLSLLTWFLCLLVYYKALLHCNRHTTPNSNAQVRPQMARVRALCWCFVSTLAYGMYLFCYLVTALYKWLVLTIHTIDDSLGFNPIAVESNYFLFFIWMANVLGVRQAV